MSYGTCITCGCAKHECECDDRAKTEKVETLTKLRTDAELLIDLTGRGEPLSYEDDYEL